MFETRNDLPLATRTQAVRLLNARLADAIDLGTQTKHAHWNVRGPNFIALHELFDQLAEHTEEHIDTIAAAARATSLKPYPENLSEGVAHVRALATARAAFGAGVRAAIDAADTFGDKDSADLFTGMSRAVDKDLWFLEAHLHAKR
jgi:starvation-inducible DNA-binding protein